jgi:hypothetical protein
MEHLIANKAVPIVRIARRIFLDVKDLDALIDACSAMQISQFA